MRTIPAFATFGYCGVVEVAYQDVTGPYSANQLTIILEALSSS